MFPQGGLFGKPTAFGQPASSTGFTFNQQTSQAGGLFGAKPATSTGAFGFGQTSTSGFGKTTPSLLDIQILGMSMQRISINIVIIYSL